MRARLSPRAWSILWFTSRTTCSWSWFCCAVRCPSDPVSGWELVAPAEGEDADEDDALIEIKDPLSAENRIGTLHVVRVPA